MRDPLLTLTGKYARYILLSECDNAWRDGRAPSWWERRLVFECLSATMYGETGELDELGVQPRRQLGAEFAVRPPRRRLEAARRGHDSKAVRRVDGGGVLDRRAEKRGERAAARHQARLGGARVPQGGAKVEQRRVRLACAPIHCRFPTQL